MALVEHPAGLGQTVLGHHSNWLLHQRDLAVGKAQQSWLETVQEIVVEHEDRK